jgi:hypothetical protein
MANRWIREPDLEIPPAIGDVYYIGFVVPALRAYCYFQVDVRATIRGSLQCERGGIRNVTVVVLSKVMVPVSPTELVLAGVFPGKWLKGAWMARKGTAALAAVLRTEKTVERTLKTITDSTDAICSGRFKIGSQNTIVIERPIWLDDRYRPMIMLPPDRAAAPDPQRGKRVG